MEHFYKNIEGWFTYEKLFSDMVNKNIDDAHFVEIGAWLGKSSAYMAVEIANSKKNIKFDVIDTWKGSVEHQSCHEVISGSLYNLFLENTKPVSNYINPIQMSSLDAVQKYSDNSLDFVFIDASHEYIDVKNDMNAWYPKVKSGGVLAGHDYEWVSVKQAVDEFLSEKSYSMCVNPSDVSDTWGFVWGITKK